MGHPVDNEQWREFFEQLRNTPVIWKTSHRHYKNKEYREKGWADMLEVYKKIDPDATLESVRKKVINVRTVFNREFKKVSDSKRSSNPSSEIYVPTLWYYKYLDFLRNQRLENDNNDSSSEAMDYKMEVKSLSSADTLLLSPEPMYNCVASMSSFVNGNVGELHTPNISRITRQTSHFPEACNISPILLSNGEASTSNSRRRPPGLRRVSDDIRSSISDNGEIYSPPAKRSDDLKNITADLSNSEKEEARVYFDTWIFQYRNLSRDQRLNAKRLIDDILIYGQMEKLDFSSFVQLKSRDHHNNVN